MILFTGDSQIWYPEGNTTPEGSELENLLTSLRLYQIINEHTNFELNKNPSCIDLIITDQPNLVHLLILLVIIRFRLFIAKQILIYHHHRLMKENSGTIPEQIRI